MNDQLFSMTAWTCRCHEEKLSHVSGGEGILVAREDFFVGIKHSSRIEASRLLLIKGTTSNLADDKQVSRLGRQGPGVFPEVAISSTSMTDNMPAAYCKPLSIAWS